MFETVMSSNFIMDCVQFIILKINGIDVRHLQHYEAVGMFLSASDPIMLEVCRKRDNFKQQDNNDPHIANNGKLELISAISSETKITALTNNENVNCASSSTLISSPQNNTTTNVAINNLSLCFSPPSPTNYQSTMCIQSDDLNNVDMIVTSKLNKTRNCFDTTKNMLCSTTNLECNYNAKLQPPPAPSLKRNIAKPQLISTAMQTDISDFVSLFHVSNSANSDEIINREHTLFEACLAPEIDIEEITLRKSESNEHLGLTVCYSLGGDICINNANITNGATTASEDSSEVYISDIQPDSIAGRDGRLRQGDQILQVNGKDVYNKKETETLIAENNNAVTLLVSRYLYADEDDFNDTCVAGIDVEVDDCEEEDEDYEFYNDNNSGYKNCFMTANECVPGSSTKLDGVLLGVTGGSTDSPTQRSTINTAIASTRTTSSLTKHDEGSHNRSYATVAASAVNVTTSPTKTASQKIKSPCRNHLLMKYDALNHLNIKAHLKQVNQELAMLDCRVENLMIKQTSAANTTVVDYDTEHIYETIPEDSEESEPLYCSPYENLYAGPSAANQGACTPVNSAHVQQQKQRVAAWLGMQSIQRHHLVHAVGRGTTMLHYPRSSLPIETLNSTDSKTETVLSVTTTATTGTTGTTGSSSSGGACINEQENSSSAYNTGGSNNSSTELTLVLNPQARNNEQLEQLTALRINKSQRLISPMEKQSSPKHQGTLQSMSLFKMSVEGGATPTAGSFISAGCQAATTATRSFQQAPRSASSHQHISTSTMYTNVANLQQTMLLQQQLFRQALSEQQEQQQNHCIHLQQQQRQSQESQQHNLQMHTCPQFTAPNLSQYHFVSSQEVSPEQICAATSVAAKASREEPMVWKVKRRQDGTRYIVRRPARNNMLRDRALRMNTKRENFELTTEDDTISEIKTGRYWTREERKKHIERVRERRRYQQQQLATEAHLSKNKPSAGVPSAPHFTKSQRPSSTKLQHHQLQFASVASANAETTAAHMFVCNTNKKLMLKVNSSFGSVEPQTTAVSVASIVVNVANVDDVLSEPTTTIRTVDTAITTLANANDAIGAQQSTIPQGTTNGNKMIGLLSVTTV